MEQKKLILDILTRIATDFELHNFYNPDGLAPYYTPSVVILPYDRLLFILDGVKIEPMSLDGSLQKVRLTRGDYYLIRKNIWECAARVERHELFYIMIRGSYLRLARHTMEVPNMPWGDADYYHTSMMSDSISEAFSLLKTVVNPEYAAVIVRLIAKMVIEEVNRPTSGLMKAQMTFEDIRNHVEQRFTESLSRESVAGHFGLNHSYVSQIFRKFTGHSFQDYVTDCRMNKAKYLLTHTQQPIKEIAENCGFPNNVYFVRRFRECTGLPPGRYRIQQKSKIAAE